MGRRTTALLAPLAAAALAVAGCGGSDDTSSAADPAASTTPAASTAAATTPAASGAQDVTNGRVTVKMSEFAFTPKDITAPAGRLVITAPNVGQVPHELVLLKTNRDAGSFPVKDGRMSEEGPGVESAGEISETPAGKTGRHAFDLKPGNYAMVCNIVGHYSGGMWGTLVVK
jgi:plastocyanin